MKVAIVGPGAAQGAGAFYDESWQIWGINSAYRQHRARWTKMFNLHRLRHLERDCPQYVDWDSVWSRRHPMVPMVVVDSWKGLLKNQVLFPRAALARQPRADYHASSFDWLLAYAIHLKAKLIHVHGARFALDSPREEPISARACLEYWCGYAQGLGIQVTEHRDCELFVQYHLVQSRTVYGYDDVHMVEYRK
jgi:hypothetical protein